MNYYFLAQVAFRCLISVLIGSLIGNERARHGRAAGMRTHILVCIGAALTSMISIYVSDVLGQGGDVLRISAQVISGIGFLGAGMIILKSNNVITGLTTAAGVWTTSVIGIAVGFGFYSGAIIATVLFMITTTLFSKFEKNKKATEIIYVEIDDMYRANKVISDITTKIDSPFMHRFVSPKTLTSGHLGVNIIIDKRLNVNIDSILEIENVVFVEDE